MNDERELEGRGFDSLVSDYLDAKRRGQPLDRYQLLADNPEQAEALLAFFKEQDTQEGSKDPDKNLLQKQPPPVANSPRKKSMGARVLHAGVGCLAGISLGAILGYVFAPMPDEKTNQYFLYLPGVFSIIYSSGLGAIIGGALGIPSGLLIGAWDELKPPIRDEQQTVFAVIEEQERIRQNG